MLPRKASGALTQPATKCGKCGGVTQLRKRVKHVLSSRHKPSLSPFQMHNGFAALWLLPCSRSPQPACKALKQVQYTHIGTRRAPQLIAARRKHATHRMSWPSK